MGRETPALFLKLLNNLCEDGRYPAACDLPSGSASAEVGGNEAPVAEASSVVDVDAEFSTMNKIEMQSVQIIAENPWHLFQSGILTLRDNKGERVPFGEPVLIVREFFRLATSQQEELRAQGINRLVWERLPLAGHAILFFTRSWEIGRMTA